MGRNLKQILSEIKELYNQILIPTLNGDDHIAGIKKQTAQEYEAELTRIQTAYQAVELRANQVFQDIEATEEKQFQHGCADASNTQDSAKTNALTTLQTDAERLQTIADDYSKRLGILASPWNDPVWNTYQPFLRSNESHQLPSQGYDTASGVPGGVRIGTLISTNDPIYPLNNVPAMLPFVGKGHIVIISHGGAKAKALHLLQSIITRLYCTYPVNTLRTVRFDPLGLGDNFPFKRLPDVLRGGNVSSEGDEIRQQMRELTEHMRLVTEKYLAKDFVDIEAYNQKAEEIVEPYRVLTVADFPVKFDGDACTRLLSIAERGIRTGVYIVMHLDGDQAAPREFNRNELLRYASCIECFSDKDGERFTFKPINEDQTYHFIPDSTPSAEIFNRMLDEINAKAQRGQFQGIPLSKMLKDVPQWQGDASELIEVPIGKAGAKDTLAFWLGQRPDRRISAHALIGGQTGSGKSNLLHALIASLAHTYSPDELELYLLDFKEGVEFRPYADEKLPHVRVVAIESEREFAVSVLRELQRELEQRAQTFKAANVTNLKDYRKNTGQAMSRIVLIIDEFQKMFESPDAITNKLSQMIDDLAKRGRSFGIHLVMGSQSVRGANMPINSYGQFSTRIALQAPEQDITALLGSDNALAAQLLERPGEVIYNDDGGNRNRNQRGQVARLSDEDILAYLRNFPKTHFRKGSDEAHKVFVFRGNEAAKLSDNERLESLYNETQWITPAEAKAKFDLRDWITAERPALAWIGEAIEIKPHSTAAFKRRSRSNLLIVGDDEQLIFGMLAATYLSLPLFHKPEEVKFRIIDLSLKDETWEDTCENFRDSFDMYDIKVVERRGVETMIDEVFSIVEERYGRYKAGEDDLGETIYSYVGSAHRSAALKPVTGRMGNEPSEHAKKLAQIAARGPEVGVHLIFTCDNTKTFESIFTRSSLSNFDRRIALRMNREESQMLLGEPFAESLRPFRALLLDDDASTPIEKFKPYAMPESKAGRAALFQEYAAKFKKRL